jgi:CRP/FNR family cyclic AMP-dependent transcriptional regulator
MADIFYKLTAAEIEEIASISEELVYRFGEQIFDENSREDELYVIAKGAVDILVDPNLVDPQTSDAGPVETIIRLQRGQSFGELALVDRGSRSASAQAASEETLLISIPREALIDLCDKNPILGYRLFRNLAADLSMKLRKTDLYLRRSFLEE